MKQEQKSIIKIYVIAILIPLLVAAASTLLTIKNMDIYTTLNTPPLSPPAILFPIVWTILYILMGISSAMVFIKNRSYNACLDNGLSFYLSSLILNFCWSIIFFNMRSFLVAFLVLLALLYFIIRTIISYKRVSPIASYLQIPYALWVTFAGYLNIGIWYLNR